MPPLSPTLLGVLFALASSCVWGAGDFTGGYATRRTNQYQVLVLSAFSGLVVLILAALVGGESLPTSGSLAWAMLGGATGGLGIAALYRALSMGPNTSVAPTAGVIGAALPVVFGALTAGLPGASKLVGFGLALTGIGLVSTSANGANERSRQSFWLACLAGLGFGGYFIFIGLVENGKIFTPLIASRSMALLTGLLLVWLNRLPLPGLGANRTALLAGVLDVGGNLFYILAKQYTRLDVAAVLSSLYPAATILLAALILKEKVSRVQGLGAIICLAAIVMITL